MPCETESLLSLICDIAHRVCVCTGAYPKVIHCNRSFKTEFMRETPFVFLAWDGCQCIPHDEFEVHGIRLIPDLDASHPTLLVLPQKG